MSGTSPFRGRLAEAVVIVLSILLAFGIDAWWQDRVERSEEARLLEALLAEFEINQQRLAEITSFHTDLRATAEELLAIAADPTHVIVSDSLDRLLGDVSWWGGFNSLEAATLDAVILGGDLARIRSDSLRTELTAWRREVEAAVRVERQEYDFFHGVWTPFLRQNTDIAQISNSTTGIPGSPEPYYGGQMPAVQDRTDHSLLLRNREFRNALALKVWIENDVLNEYGGLRPRLDRLIELLAAEIAR